MSDQFEDKEYRDAYVEANIHNGIAFQVRALRKKKNWTQGELGDKCGKAQNVISRIEDPDYGKYTIRTLCDLASAFDVALLVKFVSFGELRAQTKDLSPEALAVPSFDEERALRPCDLLSNLVSPKFANHFDAALKSGSYAKSSAIAHCEDLVRGLRLVEGCLVETRTKRDESTDTEARSAMTSYSHNNRQGRREVA